MRYISPRWFVNAPGFKRMEVMTRSPPTKVTKSVRKKKSVLVSSYKCEKLVVLPVLCVCQIGLQERYPQARENQKVKVSFSSDHYKSLRGY